MKDRILVVEDERNMCLLLKEELEEDGYEVFTALNAEQAVEIFMKTSEIAVVTIDIEMPGMNGLELAGVLRNDYPDLRIILLTAYSHHRNDLSCWAADAYIVKSSDLSELKNKIKELL